VRFGAKNFLSLLYRRHRHPHGVIIGVGVPLPILKDSSARGRIAGEPSRGGGVRARVRPAVAVKISAEKAPVCSAPNALQSATGIPWPATTVFQCSPAPRDLGSCGEEIAETVVLLCSDAASFVTGHTMLVLIMGAGPSRAVPFLCHLSIMP
jgi:hypothetical protein